MGADQWKYARDLGSVATSRQLLYLDSPAGRAQDVFSSGTLSPAPPGASPPDRYAYNPLDVTPAELEREPNPNPLTDQRFALRIRGNALVYHSAPFERETEITGVVRFVAWMSIDVPDTDFRVTVYEILPDGSSVMLTEDFLRARYRESQRQARLVVPGAILRYEFDTFQYFSREIAKGSRLRLVVTSPNSIYLEKNYNGGGVVAEESRRDARTAHVTLYHDTEHRSYLELPIVEAR
jgi:putative CocE/NonD family hydrolase